MFKILLKFVLLIRFKFLIFKNKFFSKGKENDIMIISLVRSEGIGFLKDYRRVNVATSRAQYA